MGIQESTKVSMGYIGTKWLENPVITTIPLVNTSKTWETVIIQVQGSLNLAITLMLLLEPSVKITTYKFVVLSFLNKKKFGQW